MTFLVRETSSRPRSCRPFSKLLGVERATLLEEPAHRQPERPTHRPYLMSSYVSPSSGLNGLPVLSHWEATADTAKAATHCKQHTGMSGSPAGGGSQGLQGGSGTEIPWVIIYSLVTVQSSTCKCLRLQRFREMPLPPTTSSKPEEQELAAAYTAAAWTSYRPFARACLSQLCKCTGTHTRVCAVRYTQHTCTWVHMHAHTTHMCMWVRGCTYTHGHRHMHMDTHDMHIGAHMAHTHAPTWTVLLKGPRRG